MCLIVACFWHCFNSTPFSHTSPHTPVRMSIKSHFGLHFCISFCFFQLRALHGVSRKARLANMRSGGAAEGIDSGALSILITFHGNCESKCMKFCCFCRRDLAQSEIRVTRAHCSQTSRLALWIKYTFQYLVSTFQYSVYGINLSSSIFVLSPHQKITACILIIRYTLKKV